MVPIFRDRVVFDTAMLGFTVYDISRTNLSLSLSLPYLDSNLGLQSSVSSRTRPCASSVFSNSKS